MISFQIKFFDQIAEIKSFKITKTTYIFVNKI